MVDWKPVFVLPNIELTEPIEGDLAALAPAHDPRVTLLSRTHANLQAFLRKFTDAFGVKQTPSVLLIQSDAPQSFYDIGTLASFRDLVAVAVVAYNRALALTYSRQPRILFGNTFALYPWMIDRNYEYLLSRTPAHLGLHVVKEFRGQSSPELSRMRLGPGSIDEPLLSELVARWRRCYESPRPNWSDLALFRSLNMAYHASLLPAASDTTLYDIGRLISLWVSAFEILVHPGGRGKTNREKVFGLLEEVPCEALGCVERSYDTGGKIKVKRTLGSWIYQNLCDRRNDFLHGNPVTPESLLLPVSGRRLFDYAGPLYRFALTAFLPLVFKHEVQSPADPQAFGAYHSSWYAFRSAQRTIEDALLTAVRTPTGQDDT